MESIVSRYLPNPELLQLCGQMRNAWNRSTNLMGRLSDKTVQQLVQYPPSGEEKQKYKRMLGALDNAIYTYAGEKMYHDVLENSPYVDAFITHSIGEGSVSLGSKPKPTLPWRK